MNGKPKRIIAVANEKGGVGKTVTTVNLAAALAQAGNRVLLVDLDPQHNTTKGVGVTVDDSMATTYDIISNHKSPVAKEAIISTKWPGLDLIPAHPDLAGADIELANEYGRENRLKKGMKDIHEQYDFIFIDTPPSLSLLTVNVFSYANEVIVPCQTHPYAYDAMEGVFDTISDIREEINPSLTVTGVVATLFDGRTRVGNAILQKLQQDKRYKKLLFNSVIRVNTTIAESADVGEPVVFFRHGSYGAMDYKDLAQELVGSSHGTFVSGS
jgi:chromosome partitioning protein